MGQNDEWVRLQPRQALCMAGKAAIHWNGLALRNSLGQVSTFQRPSPSCLPMLHKSFATAFIELDACTSHEITKQSGTLRIYQGKQIARMAYGICLAGACMPALSMDNTLH